MDPTSLVNREEPRSLSTAKAGTFFGLNPYSSMTPKASCLPERVSYGDAGMSALGTASQRKQMRTATLEQGHGDKDEGMLSKNRQALREE